jgi:hypothetical protein
VAPSTALVALHVHVQRVVVDETAAAQREIGADGIGFPRTVVEGEIRDVQGLGA